MSVGPRRPRTHHRVVELPEIDQRMIERTHRIVEPICRAWFRYEVRHLDRVPLNEPTLLVGNHDGGNLPVDAVCLGAAWYNEFGYGRPLRVMMHKTPFQMGRRFRDYLHSCGCVSANPDNFEAMARNRECGLVYPGGARESFRLYRDRKRVDLGGRKGFIVRALRNGMTISPVVSVGGHETMFILWRGEVLARFLKIDKYFNADAWPLIVGLPLGIWLGPFIPHLPLPAKITLEVLPPIRLAEEIAEQIGRRTTDVDADDPAVVQIGFDLVRTAMQAAMSRLYAERKLPIFG